MGKLLTADVATEACVECKYTDRIEACPVSCFYEGESLLVINPDACIGSVCADLECPANATESENDDGECNSPGRQ